VEQRSAANEQETTLLKPVTAHSIQRTALQGVVRQQGGPLDI
jgi:hypothetical protein